MTREQKIRVCLSQGLSPEEAEKSWYVNNPLAEYVFDAICKKLLESLNKKQ